VDVMVVMVWWSYCVRSERWI